MTTECRPVVDRWPNIHRPARGRGTTGFARLVHKLRDRVVHSRCEQPGLKRPCDARYAGPFARRRGGAIHARIKGNPAPMPASTPLLITFSLYLFVFIMRSDERRVGIESVSMCRSRW